MVRDGKRRSRRAVPVARRALFHDRRRAALSIGGVAAALSLVLILNGVVAGAMGQVSAYIDRSPADLFVSQEGVRTMHMSVTVLPPATVQRVRRVPGVAWVEPLRYTTGAVQSPGRQLITYVLGYDTRSGRAGPRTIVAGRAPTTGEVVMDRDAAGDLGVTVGDRVDVLGATLRVSGLSTNGTNIVNTTVFVSAQQFEQLRGPALSYLLVGAKPGTSPAELSRRVDAKVPGVTVQTRQQFSHEERQLVRDMAADIMTIMTSVGLVIALAVVGLTLFTVTLSRLRDYGIQKALGATGPSMAGQVVTQAMWTVGSALVVATIGAVVVAAVVARATSNLRMVISPADVARVGLMGLVVAAIAAVAPLRKVASVDPASAFRRTA